MDTSVGSLAKKVFARSVQILDAVERTYRVRWLKKWILCACVRERERERQGERQRKTDTETGSVCMPKKSMRVCLP